jgi:hypothetical protein
MRGVYVVSVEALPLQGSANADAYEGAYINVYVVSSSEGAAIESAKREVAESGWRTCQVEKIVFVNREDFVAGSDGVKYFDQAQIDGVVAVVHTYALDQDEGYVHH